MSDDHPAAPPTGEPPVAPVEDAALSKGKKKDREHDEALSASLVASEQERVAKQLLALQMQGGLSGAAAARTLEESAAMEHKFWKTQPVPQLHEDVTECGPIEPDKEHVQQEPYNLPQGFEWDTLDLLKQEQLDEVYKLLNENYVEDDDNMFRFDYSSEFLKWALMPPGWKAIWHAGVRVSINKKLVGFISAIPATLRVHTHSQLLVEINFLCVHKKLRSKRLAPVLIKEITRRVHLQGIFQATYTAGIYIPKPIASCRYWHRSLNPKKLIEVKFSQLGRNMTMQRTIKFYKLPEKPTTVGLREMRPSDAKAACALLVKYLTKFNVAPIYSEEEFVHWFMPREGVINTFVVEDPSSHKITDLVSFYTLPSSIMNHPTYKQLRAAYSYYNVSTKTPLLQLMQDALTLAHGLGFDVFNALDLMDNEVFLKELKFGIGDGCLQYYLYNYKCPFMQPNKMGLVLL